ncbi:hypothetical protein HY990_07395 [Candidatus Micrarchaeota archaeon]|nr:hypothetical protein [Candidatus Micrarchaeota archaeon]
MKLHQIFLSTIILLLFISTTIFASCQGGYNDSFTLRILDAKYRPLPDAVFTMKYDTGSAAYGKAYFTTANMSVDQNAQKFVYVTNSGAAGPLRTLDCDITINAYVLGGGRGTTVVTGSEHGAIVDVVVSNAYPIVVTLQDQFGVPLQNASITIAKKQFRSDNNGEVRTYIGVGDQPYEINYLEGAKSGTINVVDDTIFPLTLRGSSIRIDLYNQKGEPIDANITIFGKEQIVQNGILTKDKVFGDEIKYQANYRGVTKNGTIYPERSNYEKIVFDIEAPAIGEITTETRENITRLNIQVTDQGTMASGVDTKTFKLSYRVEPEDPSSVWQNALVYTSSRELMSAEIPELPSNKIVQFKIEVKDKEGNLATLGGRFTSPKLNVTTPAIDQNSTNTQPTPPSTQPQEQGIPLLYIVIGGILLILIGFLVFRTMFSGKSS